MPQDPVDIEVGVRIRLRRKLLGLSQKVLADAVGVTFQQIQKYERGTNRVGASRLLAIADVLHVPVSHFFEVSEPTRGKQVNEEDELFNFVGTVEGLDLNKSFSQITDEHVRWKILSLVKAIANAEIGSLFSRME